MDQNEKSDTSYSKKNLPEKEKENTFLSIDKMQAGLHVNPKSERGEWGRSIEFLLSCISMSVGLGNVWRFPNAAYNNGGGAFLIPYLILLVIIGRPLYYMELIMGQFSGSGPVQVWRCVPGFKGLGYAQMISISYVLIFYNYLMALTLFYLFASMQYTLPWTECDPEWAINNVCDNHTALNKSGDDVFKTSLSEQYWMNHVIRQSKGLDEITWINWKLALCLLLSWFIVFVIVMRGVESLGKVTYFTAFFPYVVLIALLIVTLLEEGSAQGIKYFFTPDWKKLLEIEVWYNACEQSFFSLSVGYGSLIMFSSYNGFKKNVYRDAIIVSVLDTFTSIIAGCVVFAVLGTLAHQLGTDITEVANKRGLGLAFVAYPEALGRIHIVPQLWSVLFFIMLYTLGVGSSMALLETVLTCIRDSFPYFQQKKWLLSLLACIFFFLCGIPLTTNAGQYIMKLLDNYGAATAAMLYAIIELSGIMWIYGWRNFCYDVKFMLDKPVGIFWKITWVFAAPIALIVIFVYGNIIVSLDSSSVEGIPWWGTLIGWILAAVAVFQIPLWMFHTYWKMPQTDSWKRFKALFQPTVDWGPSDPVYYQEWIKRSDNSKTPEATQNDTFVYENFTYINDNF